MAADTTCSKCDGYGVVDTMVVGGGGSEFYASGDTCPRCMGTGHVHDVEDSQARPAFNPRSWDGGL